MELAKVLIPESTLGKFLGLKIWLGFLTPVIVALFVAKVWSDLLGLIVLFLGLTVGGWLMLRHYDKVVERKSDRLAEELFEEYKKQKKGES